MTVVSDALIQKHRPVLTVPHSTPLPALSLGMVRFLMAEGGLLVETNQRWGTLRRFLWRAPFPLPYGAIEEHDGFTEAVEQTLAILEDEMLHKIRRSANEDKEWFGAVFMDRQGRFFMGNAITRASSSGVRYKYDDSTTGPALVAEVHSHGRDFAFFSPQDNTDDMRGVKLSFVVGRCRRGGNCYKVIWRYCIDRFLFEQFERRLR